MSDLNKLGADREGTPGVINQSVNVGANPTPGAMTKTFRGGESDE